MAGPDVGLQLERTLLAWRRTALAGVLAAAGLVHLLERSPALGLAIGAVGLTGHVALGLWAVRRYRAALHRAGGRVGALVGPLPDGLPVLALTVAQVVAGLGAIAWVATR